MMIHIPVLTYIVIWVIASFLVLIFCYALIQWSKQRVPRKFHEKLVVREEFRSIIDRRSGVNRRKVHNLDYFLEGGVERRGWKERRSNEERRKNWVRGAEGVSVFVCNLRGGKASTKLRI
jgi:hypothetical protein